MGIVVAFVIFFSIMTTAIVIAATHRDSLVDENYYESELKFQSQIDAAHRAAQAGATVSYDVATAKVLIRIPVSQVTTVLKGQISLYCPFAAKQDRQLAFQPDHDGTQTVDLSALNPGSWVIRVRWQAGEQDYFLEQKIAVTAK